MNPESLGTLGNLKLEKDVRRMAAIRAAIRHEVRLLLVEESERIIRRATFNDKLVYVKIPQEQEDASGFLLDIIKGL